MHINPPLYEERSESAKGERGTMRSSISWGFGCMRGDLGIRLAQGIRLVVIERMPGDSDPTTALD